MSTRRDLEQIAELAPRVANYYTTTDLAGQTVWDRIGLAMQGHPSAGRWDLERSSGTPFCWLHQCDLRDCHDQDRTGCDVENIKVNDPTGEAAGRADGAADDERLAGEHIRKILKLLVALEDIGSRHPPTRHPNDYEKELSSGSDPQCESCQRFRDDRKKPYWSAPMLNGSGQPYRTTLKDTLTQPLYLCWTCCRHTERKGMLPNEQEIVDHHEKGRMTCRHDDRKDQAA